jgi:hypothetical protein
LVEKGCEETDAGEAAIAVLRNAFGELLLSYPHWSANIDICKNARAWQDGDSRLSLKIPSSASKYSRPLGVRLTNTRILSRYNVDSTGSQLIVVLNSKCAMEWAVKVEKGLLFLTSASPDRQQFFLKEEGMTVSKHIH